MPYPTRPYGYEPPANSHENPLSFEVIEIVRLANSLDSADNEQAWARAQTLHLDQALQQAGNPLMQVVDGALAGFFVNIFSDQENVETVLQANFDAAEADFVNNIDALRQELGVLGTSVAVSVISARYLRNLGRSIRGFNSATNSVPTRPLTADDLGIRGNLSQLDGTFSVQNGVTSVRMNMIEGSITNPFRIVDNLVDTARRNGSTSLHIEGTIANPRLYDVLQRRYGLTSQGANDVITIPIE